MASEPTMVAERDTYRISTTNQPEKPIEDPDTCRICRGEGSIDEPLFYPCKCSGSIKFVHQDCLMEWLSHSQKKYCELCKTPFRFTKLYQAGMPNHIPTSVFIRRAAVHVLKMLITWCRGILVGSVWLLMLPYCMRVVWRSLFWVGDGGWVRELYLDASPSPVDPRPTRSITFDMGTVKSAISSAKAANTSLSLPFPPGFFSPYSQTLNMTGGEPTVWAIVKRWFFGMPYPIPDSQSTSGTNVTASNATVNPLGSRNPSLLSEVSFFNWFPSQAANRFTIDVLEGQIITLLVVVAFILIFLIREWVVQQQPVINMVAINEDGAAERAHDHAQHAVGEHVDHDADDIDDQEEAGFAHRVADDFDDDEDLPQIGRDRPQDRHHRVEDDESEEDNGYEEEFRPAPRIRNAPVHPVRVVRPELEGVPESLRRALQADSIEDIADIINSLPDNYPAGPQFPSLPESQVEGPPGFAEYTRGRGEHEDIHASSSTAPQYPERSSSLPQHGGGAHDVDSLGPPSPPRRPDMPARNRSFIAAEIRRSMEETNNTWSFANVPESTSKEHDVDSHVDSHVDSQDENLPNTWEDDDGYERLPSRGNETNASSQEQSSENSSESWQQVPPVLSDNEADQEEHAASSRGKDKVDSADEEPKQSTASENACASVEQAAMHADTSHEAEDVTIDETNPSAETQEPEENEEPADRNATPEAAAPEQVQQLDRPPRRLVDTVLDWLFGDIAPNVQAAEVGANDEHVVQDLANEAPFVAFGGNAGNAGNEPRNAPVPPIRDPEVAAAAAQAGIDVNDQDAIDDAEDLEGIMELIGMQGPLTGLFQNAMFSAVLISATLACAVWFPYLCGKVVLLFMGSPLSLFVKFPLQFIAALCDFVVDTAICLGAGGVFWTAQFVGLMARIFTLGSLPAFMDNGIQFVAKPAKSVAESAMDRIARLVYESSPFPHPDYFRLSINSHVALRSIQNTTSFALNQTGNAVATIYNHVSAESPVQTLLSTLRLAPAAIQYYFTYVYTSISAFASWLWTSKSYNITVNLDSGHNATSTLAALEPWTAGDRSIAIIAGYAFFAMIGALYLKRGSPISSSQQGRKVEQIISDILQQAGGVLKVILIISIEMLVFPLYCGLLLDFALLPLFSNATVTSRWHFARQSPWTSGFVHWFIGTCYMFHFALFVSMCRKIMRRGVLYFIRDPDDPTFHPVRDVLERSVTTQLRKIAFSALVYGALVIVCLGGVVWILNRTTTQVLPIHFASQAPSVEFPLDLLFYNFLTPLIIKLYKPSEGLQAIYQWWFKACARVLRLSNFLFGEKVRIEEGRLVKRPWHYKYTRWFTGTKSQGQRLTPETTETPEEPVEDSFEIDSAASESEDEDEEIEFEGRYVRAPASDQVRIPKGQRVFVEVNPENERLDGKQDEGGVHNSDLVTMVYIPPWFRVRIALFVLTIWIFAAVSGVGATVIPLLFGRFLFSLVLPSTMETNDIHAFSVGTYMLGAIAYGVYHAYKFVSSLNQPVPSPLTTLVTLATTASRFGLRVLRFGYVWLSFLFIFPLMFSILLELYFLMPLHAYLGPDEPHVVHIVQDWTLGFLYARLAARILFSDRTSRAARAFAAITTDGYLNPNARIATRCFVIPVLAIFLVAVAVPAAVACVLLTTVWADADKAIKAQVFRFSFPLIGLMLGTIFLGRQGALMLMRWRMLIRDEEYLMGERLHNFGDRRAAQSQQAAATS